MIGRPPVAAAKPGTRACRNGTGHRRDSCLASQVQGQLELIDLVAGEIVDGWHRYRACEICSLNRRHELSRKDWNWWSKSRERTLIAAI